MTGIPGWLRSESALRQIFSVMSWASIGVLGVLIALFGQGTLKVDPAHADFLYFGLGSAALLSGCQLFVCHLRTQGRVKPSELSSSGRLSAQPLDYLVSLLNVSRAVSNDVALLDLGQVIVDSCRDSFECDEVSLMMVEPTTSELTVTAFAGHRDVAKVRNARVRLGEGVAGTVAQSRTPVLLGPEVDTKRFPGFQTKSRKIKSAMVAPIVVRNRVVGVLNASVSNTETSYSEDDLRVLCILAEHAGIVAAKAGDNDRVVRLIRRMRKRHQMRMAEAGLMPSPEIDRRDAA